MELTEAEGGKGGAAQKRKRSDADGEVTGVSKQGGRCHGHKSTSVTARIAVGKVVASSVRTHVVVAESEPTIAPMFGPTTGARPSRMIPTLATLPLLQMISSDEVEEEDEEKEMSKGSGDHKGGGSSSPAGVATLMMVAAMMLMKTRMWMLRTLGSLAWLIRRS